jgi:hypothetical protein
VQVVQVVQQCHRMTLTETLDRTAVTQVSVNTERKVAVEVRAV